MKTSMMLIFLVPSIGLWAGVKDEYAVSLIPDSLLTGANSVVRASEVTLSVSAPGKAEYHFHKVVTVLNEGGAHELNIVLEYDKFIKISSFNASLYDKNGKLMNKRSESDMHDYAAYDGYSLYSDDRIKRLQTSGGGYPVTIDYSYTMQFNGLMGYPSWNIQNEHQSVESCRFQLEAPHEIAIKYENFNTDVKPVITDSRNLKSDIYEWEVKDLMAVKPPYNSYDASYFLPHINIRPDVFEIAGYKGSFENWNNFGASINKMWENTRILSDSVVQQVQAMVKDAHTDREKAAILYSYLQHNFHYVSIQIGIGSWVPFDASTVHRCKYGDCKALSNYMCALLNIVGIKAYPALINAGRKAHPIDTGFTCSHFNHCILYAELGDGPAWLECTSNALPFGELGTFTENRYALVLDENGGRIVKTPASNSELNGLTVSNVLDVGNDLKAKISFKASIEGEFRGSAKNALLSGTEKERADYIFNSLTIKRPESYSLNNIRDSLSKISFQMNGDFDKIYDFKTGKKIFLPSSIIKTWYRDINVDSTNQNDLVTGYPEKKTEQLTYNLPNTSKQVLPKDYTLNNALISFKRKCTRPAENKIFIETEFSLKRNIIAASDIPLLKESLKNIDKYLREKLIIEAN